uniref:RRM domain-containing protein n=1 Tax=Amphimedon queenslandica TaxID=400682 RepID=A0A1X7VLM1_AMPQE
MTDSTSCYKSNRSHYCVTLQGTYVLDLRDAEDALHNLDGTCLHGRELVVQYAEGDRKTPFQMKNKERTGSYNRRRYSRSPSPYYSRRSHSPYNRRRRRGSPRSRRRRSRSRSYSRSGSRSRSPPPRRRRSQSRSRSPYSRSPVRSRSRSYSRSPGGRGRSYSRSPSRSPRSKSPKQ